MTDLSNFDLQRAVGWLLLLMTSLTLILWRSRHDLRQPVRDWQTKERREMLIRYERQSRKSA